MADLNFHIITLFPEVVETYVGCGVIGKAVEKGLIGVDIVHLRDFTSDRHRTVDDTPYGGGAGMILMPEPIFLAVEKIKSGLQHPPDAARVVMMTPHGTPLTAKTARNMADFRELLIFCGHYGGVDERVREQLVDEEISAGDFVLTGGELPGLMFLDAVARFVPGVVGNEESVSCDSFEGSLIGAPQYTRPADFRGWKVPDVLLSGNHGAVDEWRREQRLRRTYQRRPELLEKAELSERDIAFLRSLGYPK